MTRIGRDSVTPADVPVSGTQVAIGYANGKYSWAANTWTTRFPAAAKCVVDVNGSDPSADMLDVEPGDASVATAVEWTRKKLALKGPYLPIIYCNRSTLTPLFNAMNAAGYFIGRHFLIGIATLDGTKTVSDMTGVWGVQWKPAAAATGTGHYDEWIIYDDAWKPPAKPVTPPPVKVQDAVLVQIPTGATKAVHSTDGIHWQ